LLTRRAAALGDGSAEFATGDAGDLRRAQRVRARLEQALRAATDE
ncbi:MAG: hypothetical protein HGA45_29535, partial [Chloroflexales bacterium]|nr:hypothetical protein [Chloroflexales bacterium]